MSLSVLFEDGGFSSGVDIWNEIQFDTKEEALKHGLKEFKRACEKRIIEEPKKKFAYLLLKEAERIEESLFPVQISLFA